MDISLTDREADVMQILWERGPSVVSEVRDGLTDDLAYTTVLTILRTLESKGYVTHVEEGRGHRYAAAVQRQAAQKSALRHLTSKLFAGSTELLFAQLVTDKNLTPKEIRRMRELLKERPDEE
ncbi:BlaI/MecI/CopY family transcriptional regulator [Paraburkholderia acidicola]|uniref:BlaI/MecI/CopY family transcriptional regulator n=1 Tax=Paraburkholderia acidicola TaxID=1912599 RepID=A0ABV1LIK4_9BURK